MSRLDVRLLGGFQITYDDQEIRTLQAERLTLLVSYLLLHSPKTILRKQLAFTFWADTAEDQARTNLRNLFHHLRKAFPEIDSLLEMEGQSIRWAPTAEINLDVTGFEAALKEAKAAKSDSARIELLQQAVNIYRGELLPGYYEDWILSRREELHQAYLTALSQLAKLLEDARRYEDAIEIVNRLVHSEPLDESAYQLSMRLHALNNDRAGALQAYHACVTVMRRELDMNPSAEIQTLYEQLVRSGETPSKPGGKEKGTAEVKLVGRKQEWGQIKEAWNFIQKNQARMILLRGESGIGKTRLAEELATWVQRQGFFTAAARAYPAEGELAYGAVTLWLRSLSVNHLPDVWKTEVSRLLPELLVENISPPGALSEAWQQQRFHEGVVRAVLGSQPLLLVLDDIQWADRKSLEWLRFLFRFDPQARFLLLATARNEDLAPDGAAHDLIDSLQQTGQYIEIPLQRFSEGETRQLAEQLSQDKLTQEVAAILQKQTEGLPLFIVELTRSGLHWDDASPASLPDRLLAALKERLSSLTALSRPAAEAAAVIRRDFSAALLAHIADLNESDLLTCLDELWQRHILREGERGRYDFSHDKLREFIYGSLSPARKQALHRRVAKALSDLDPEDLWGQALHLEKSGETREAAEAYFRAAKREADQASYAAAQNGYSQALGLMEKQGSPRRVETLLALARVCYVTGDQEQGTNAITEALQATSSLENDLLRFQTLTAAAELAFKTGRMDEARTWFDMAKPIALRLGDKTHEISLLLQMADMETRAGQAHPAKDLYEKSLVLAREIKSHSFEAEALEGLGFILPSIGAPLRQAGNYLEDAANLYRLMGDRLREARTLGALIGFFHAAGEYEKALELAPQVYEKDMAVNYRRGAAIVQSSQGLAAYELGQFEQARELLDKARQVFKEIGEPDGYGLHTGSLGLVATAQDQWDEAEALLKEAIAIAEENQTAVFAAFAQQDLATAYCLQNRWEDARPFFEKALATNLENNDNLGILYDKTMLGHIHWRAGETVRANDLVNEVMAKFRVESFEEGGILRWLWQFKRLLEALNREAEAAEVLAKARELFQAAAGKIQNPELRRSFVEIFPHHKELQ